jgi:hypothetical protein
MGVAIRKVERGPSAAAYRAAEPISNVLTPEMANLRGDCLKLLAFTRDEP